MRDNCKVQLQRLNLQAKVQKLNFKSLEILTEYECPPLGPLWNALSYASNRYVRISLWNCVASSNSAVRPLHGLLLYGQCDTMAGAGNKNPIDVINRGTYCCMMTLQLRFKIKWPFRINFFNVAPFIASFCLSSFFSSNHNKNCGLQQDSNSDRRQRRQARWPLDGHQGPS